MAHREAGTVLDGKYEILRRLTGGGMSEVYLVRHLHLDERRVVKVLRPEDAADPAAQARFLRAAKTATQIKHPNVAILYDYSRLPDDSFYMVWEYIDGEDIGRWVERRGPFPVDVAVDLAIQALRGLEAIHSHGVIHRDISPDNLMLTSDVKGRIRLKIIDLGLAKNLAPLKRDIEVTQVGMFMGKLRYCSPEQAGMVEGVSLDRRSDLYSFAAVFYEMLCGKPPFDSETPHGYVFKRLTEDPLPLTTRAPGLTISAALDRVVRMGLERDRDKRFASAVRFIEALEEANGTAGRFSTQKIPTQTLRSAAVAKPGATEDPSGGASRTSSQLTRQERDELLAQIQRASERLERTRVFLDGAEEALERGDLETARGLLSQAETIDPKAKGLADLKERLLSAEHQSTAGPRIAEAEKLLERYLEQHQLPLARLALATLLELAPAHPRRRDFERRLLELEGGAEQEQRAERALASGREALARGDLAAAERSLGALRKIDTAASMAAELAEEVARNRREVERERTVGAHKESFRRALQSGELGRAETALHELAELEITKITVDLYRSQLDDARRLADQAGAAEQFEQQFAARMAAGDWRGAREVALDMERNLEKHPRPASMFTEAERLREERERDQTIDQAVQQVEDMLGQQRLDQASIALRILVRLAPNHPRRSELEGRLASLVR